MELNLLRKQFEFSLKLKFEYITCPICSENDYFQKIFLPGYIIVQCKNCSFCYENPRPMLNEIPKLYKSEYFNYLENHSVDNLEIAKLNLKDVRFKEFESFLGKKKMLLDIGCVMPLLKQAFFKLEQAALC